MKKQKLIGKILSYAFLIVSAFVMMYPVLFMALGTFTTQRRFMEVVILPIPNTLNLALFRRAFGAGAGAAYRWTLIRCSWYIFVTLGVGLLGGYIFSKMKFPGKNKVFLLFLSGMVMPGMLMLVPTYLLMAWFPLVGGNNILGRGGHGFIGTWQVLFVLGWVPVFAIFLLKQSYDMIPSEYEDAARIDGAGMLTIITRIYLPLLKPPLAALTILTFLGNWNDYLWPLFTVSGHPEWYPIALRMQSVQLVDQATSPIGESNYPAKMLSTFMACWPPAVVYFALQRYFVQGMVMSGLKG